MTYEAALARVKQKHGTPFAPGSPEETAAIERFKAFFATFACDKVQRLLDQTYAPDVWFNDTLKEIEGREALRPYLEHSASAVDDCRVEVKDVVSNGQGDYYVRWSMMIKFKRFKRGQETWSIGMSHLRFDANGLVVLHQDFWNAADGLFQHVPVLGGMIRWIKKQV
ncbi:MAG TPA: nuclear transport factor 2 family protein [Xanthomonadales bacterium]|nr:nuclear transport factor 2 family protein [Xanthomonadales bacterium]